MDIASILGLVICFILMIFGIVYGKEFSVIIRFLDAPSALITFGGSFMCILASNTLQSFVAGLKSITLIFKFIGEQIALLEEAGELDRYIFGFEESYGYLSGGHVRDKDAVNASMLCCEMTAWYRSKGMTSNLQPGQNARWMAPSRNSRSDWKV